MSKLWALTRIQLKNYWFKSMQNMGSGKKKGLMFVALIWVGFVFAMMSTQLSVALYKGFSQLDMPELTFAMPFLLVSLGVIVLSISALINLFYYSNNTGFLLTLPIKDNAVILSRLAVQYIFSFFMTSLFLIPPIVIYFTNSGITIVGLIGSIIALILIPVVPLLIASILVVLLMSTIGKSVNRRAMSVVISIFALVMIFGIQALITRSAQSSDFIVNLLLSENGVLKYLGLQFPPVVWATKMIAGSMLHLALFIALNIGLILLFNALAQPLVKKTLRNFNQAESKIIVKKASYEGRSKVGALVRRNLQILYKTPAFLMNTIMLLIFPFLIIGINVLSGTQSMESLKALADTLASPEARPWLAIIIAGLFISPSLMGGFSATAITREGKYLWQLKIAPVSAKDDIMARIISCAIIVGFGVILMIPLLMMVLPISIIDIVWGLIIAGPAVYAMLAIDMCIDINRPVLNWTNPTQAMKNNMNILASFAWKALVGVVLYIFIKVVGFNVQPNIFKYLLIAGMTIVALIGHVMLRNGIKKYKTFEIK